MQLNSPGILLKSGGQLTQEEIARKAARAQTLLQCADAYIKEMLKAGAFVSRVDGTSQTVPPNAVASYALTLAESLLSLWELANREVQGDLKQ